MSDSYEFWKNIWDSKGNSSSNDLLFLDGYEHLGIDFSSKKIVENIIETLQIQPGESILEVGCGCGFLARELVSEFKYTGVDYSSPIVEKHKELFDHEVYVSEANNLDFKSDSFDYVFCYGVFQYLPNQAYAEQVIAEMTRVAKKGIYLGDLKADQTRPTHFVYPESALVEKNFDLIQKDSYNNDTKRFSAFRRLT